MLLVLYRYNNVRGRSRYYILRNNGRYIALKKLVEQESFHEMIFILVIIELLMLLYNLTYNIISYQLEPV